MRNYDNIMLHTLSKTKHSQPDFSIFTYWRNGIVFLDPQKREWFFVSRLLFQTTQLIDIV